MCSKGQDQSRCSLHTSRFGAVVRVAALGNFLKGNSLPLYARGHKNLVKNKLPQEPRRYDAVHGVCETYVSIG